MIISRFIHVAASGTISLFLQLSHIPLCICAYSVSHSVMSDSVIPWTVACQAPLNVPGKNTGVGSHSLLQGIFPTQGLNPGLPHCRQILYHLSHQGSPYVHMCVCIHIYMYIYIMSSLSVHLLMDI